MASTIAAFCEGDTRANTPINSSSGEKSDIQFVVYSSESPVMHRLHDLHSSRKS